MADMHEAMAEKNVDVMVVTGLDETACEYRNMHIKCMHVSRTKCLFNRKLTQSHTILNSSAEFATVYRLQFILTYMYLSYIVFVGLLNARAEDILYTPVFLSYIIVDRKMNNTM